MSYSYHLFGTPFRILRAGDGKSTFVSCKSLICDQNNVERVQFYNDLEVEAAPALPTDPEPDEEWPTKGEVDFQNVQLRYRPDLPLVLKDLTFNIRPGEKVGIIGRTGAGKSSMAQAIFRTVELCGGNIMVDGRDLHSIGLETVCIARENVLCCC